MATGHGHVYNATIMARGSWQLLAFGSLENSKLGMSKLALGRHPKSEGAAVSLAKPISKTCLLSLFLGHERF